MWSGQRQGLAAILHDIYRTSHREMLAQGLASDAVHAHSMMGIVPADLSIADLFVGIINAAREEVKAIEDQHTRGRPPKELAAARHRLEKLREQQAELEASFDGTAGCTVYFWTNATHEITGMTFSGEREGWGVRGVFNHAIVSLGEPAQSTAMLRGRFIGVLSPEDALAVQGLAARMAEREGVRLEAGYLWCGAIGTPAAAATLRELTRRPLLLVPNTVEGRQAVEDVRQVANTHVVWAPEGSLADWLSGQADIRKAWEALAGGKRVLFTRPFECVRADLDGLRQREGEDLKKFQVDRWVSHGVILDAKERGTVYFDGQLPYLFLHDSKDVVPVESDTDEWKIHAAQYGVASRDGLMKPLIDAIYVDALKDGTHAQVYPFVHYDRHRQAVYLFDLDRRVYKITTEKIEAVPNGTDGHLFVRNHKWAAFELLLDTPTAYLPAVGDRLLHDVRFSPGELSRRERTHLFDVYVLAMLFPELFPTRPLLGMIGPKGSAKTSTSELLGTMLFGPSFKVADITNDSRDLDASLTTDFFVVCDNADRPIAWLQDKLAIVATGGMIKRRTYYTTNKLVEYPMKAWLAITSRTPHFRREDVADRLLPFHLERFTGFRALSDLKIEVLKDRNALLTALARQVQRALGALRARDQERIVTPFRIADFAQFAIKVSDAIGFDGNIESVLRRLADEQMQFAMNGEGMFELLDEWLINPANVGRELSTGQLFRELLDVAQSTGISFPFKTPQEFGHKIDDFRSTLETVYGMETRSGRSGAKRVRLYPNILEAAKSA
jgi:hypothetical protein